MAHTSARRIVGLWIVVSILALLLAACGSGEEAADAPQEEPATAVEMEAENAAPGAAVCVVPDVVGFDQANAERMVQGVGLVPVRSAEFSDDVPEGHVIAQEPAGDTRLDPCAGDVSLVVSLGADDVATGETPAGAEPVPQVTDLREAILGKWVIIRDTNGEIEREAWMPDYDYVFLPDGIMVSFDPDGIMVSFDTMGPGLFEYILDDTKMRVDDGYNVTTLQVALDGDRMTLIDEGGYEMEFERVGSIDLAAIERIREHTREVVAGKWFFELYPDQVDDDMRFAFFYPDGTLQVISRNGRYNGNYDIVDDTHMYVTTSDEDGNEESMVMQFSLSGDRMTWVMDGMELELERIGPAD